MNIRKQTAMAIFAALLATNSAPWIPMPLLILLYQIKVN